MQNTMMNARTVALVRDLEKQTRNGARGEFESTTIFYRVAVDRNYRSTRTTADGKIEKRPLTDFFLVKFTGQQAETMKKYAAQKKADGSLVSRFLSLTGAFETYQKDVREHVELPVEIEGKKYMVSGETVLKNRTQYVFVVSSFEFLDSKNKDQQNSQASTQNDTAVAVLKPIAEEEVGDDLPVAQVAAQAVAEATQKEAVPVGVVESENVLRAGVDDDEPPF